MHRTTPLARIVRGVLLTLVGLFFLFPIFWVVPDVVPDERDRSCASRRRLFFEPTLENYVALISGKLVSTAGVLELQFMRNLGNSFFLSSCAVLLSLLLGVPAAYAFARFRFRLGEDIAFTLLSFRFAPALLVLLPLNLYFQDIGLNDTYIGLIWVYQLITLPLILWIVRGYFEDISPDIEHAYRVDGHGWLSTFLQDLDPAGPSGHRRRSTPLLHLRLEQLHLRADPGLADKQPVTVGALAFVTASGIQYGQIAAAIVLSIMPTLALALYAQRYLVEGLSLGAVKG